MSLMFEKLNTMYYYFSQSGYTEKYMKMRKIILENKYDNCDIFLTKKELNQKYKKKSRNKIRFLNDIESNLNEIDETYEIEDNKEFVEKDDESVCSIVVVDTQNKNNEEDKSNESEFCYVSMYDIV